MKKLKAILFIIPFVVIGLRLSKTQTTGVRPNIIFFYVDDLGWTDLGVQGSEFYETPVIDQLAEDGMMFTRAYANAANCAPSRACLMTGLYTPRHGIYTVASSARGKDKWRKLIPIENNEVLDTSLLTLPAYLKSVGYQTCIAGKWHLSHDPVPYGFDTNFGGFDGGHPFTYFSPYQNPFLTDGPDGEYLTDRLTDEVCKWLPRQQEPFFLYFPFYSVHTPLEAREDIIEKYQNKAPGTYHEHPVYAAMIEMVDQSIGRVLDVLEAMGQTQNTLVIFSSDNGPFGGASVARPLRGTKGMFYEGGIRVPHLVRWPGKVTPSTESDYPIMGSDLFPTILDITGRPDLAETLDGRSYREVLMGGVGEDRPLFWHFPAYLQAYEQDRGFDDANGKPNFRTTPCSVVLMDQWKLHHYYENDSVELYNLEMDVSERNNLAKINDRKRRELTAVLEQWLLATNAPIPTELNPSFDPDTRQ